MFPTRVHACATASRVLSCCDKLCCDGARVFAKRNESVTHGFRSIRNSFHSRRCDIPCYNKFYGPEFFLRCVYSLSILEHPSTQKKKIIARKERRSRNLFLSKGNKKGRKNVSPLINEKFYHRSRYRVVKKMILSDLPFPPLLIYVKGNRSSGEERKKRVLEIRGERDPIRGYTNLGGRGMMRLRTR